MKWNHATLYDGLPVTLRYAHSLPTTIKMNKLVKNI